IGMFEKTTIGGDAHRPMLQEAGIARLLSAEECTALAIQTLQHWHRMGPVQPRAGLDGHETHAPCHSAIPKARYSKNLSRRGGEFNDQVSGRGSGRSGTKGVFPTPPQWDGLGMCSSYQEKQVTEINEVRLKFFSHGRPL